MERENHIHFPNILCCGTDRQGNPVLEKAAEADIHVSRVGTSTITIDVTCSHLYGPHGDYCDASRDRKVPCLYSIDLPRGR